MHRLATYILLLVTATSVGCGNENGPSTGRTSGQSESHDVTTREALIEKIKQQGPIGYGKPGPVVSLEDFFTGNDDMGSIGCNLIDHPGTSGFHELLRNIRERPDVQDVLIEIYEFEESDETMWPYSERVYVITTASEEDVVQWLKPLQPDEITEGWFQGKPVTGPYLQSGYRIFGAWWD